MANRIDKHHNLQGDMRDALEGFFLSLWEQETVSDHVVENFIRDVT